VITSDHIERAFRRVDRKFFVPMVRARLTILHVLSIYMQSNILIHLHFIALYLYIYFSGKRIYSSLRSAPQGGQCAYLSSSHLCIGHGGFGLGTKQFVELFEYWQWNGVYLLYCGGDSGAQVSSLWCVEF
jgi:hypothetical protein